MNRSLRIVLATLAMLGCENGGATRALEISATGVVRGAVYFDANGSGARDAEDVPFPGARVRLLSPGGRDTLFRATTGSDGAFRLVDVPVGTYVALVDSASAGDTARVRTPASVVLTILPGDSVAFEGAISFPIYSTLEARARPLGERMFVRGVALHARDTFSDTTLHVADGSGAMRATRVRPAATSVAAGDSVVLRARTADRLGQRVLDDVSVFIVRPTFVPTAATLSTAVAATGGVAGSRDAQLIRLIDAAIIDTATVSGNLQMTMNDGSGPVVVILDRAADTGFRAPLPLGLYVAPNRFDLSGILVPTGTGVWRVKPRSSLDLTRR